MLKIRQDLGDWIESTKVRYFLVAIIIINGIVMGLETSPEIKENYGHILMFIDKVILYIFVIELSIKIFAFGRRFFCSGWNIFDFLIVGIALLPNSGALSILRVLRILRILRAISMVPSLRLVIESLLHAVPGIFSIASILVVLFYIFAVIGTTLFAADFPLWFGSIGRSMYTLFQIMTLESWSMGIARPVMEVFPYSWLFFVLFLIIASFAMMNLFVAVIVDTMQTLHAERREKQDKNEVKQEQAHLHQQLDDLKEEIQALKTLIVAQNKATKD